mmetsp:Transcript_31782/g.79728  ORF Transcript_31782/g.79728 Transcript_31782/m.79728 type:complete len:461 (-) Transcript_31782:520-1902(-)|eukprot:CAMPEP_0177663368 /NCGR_PEP_ID=MMETSP0447-20121125/19872_1 /TAXON_ID=0 /ORGANISM="Stygamoeba regulata, Strain BSH-02190019" /LENGTH=460 /DNA_ID=CAMNT_0019169167 /DNA_START=119 /DNA_END=1501 /DNA_ORIENTATION=+
MRERVVADAYEQSRASKRAPAALALALVVVLSLYLLWPSLRDLHSSGQLNFAGVPLMELDRLALVESTPDAVLELSSAHNRFALKLLKLLSTKSSNENILFSPFSIYNALALVSAGARGETETEIMHVLGFDHLQYTPADRVLLHAVFRDFLLEQMRDGRFDLYTGVAVEKSYGLHDDFRRFASEYYAAEVLPVDFVHEFSRERNRLNELVEKHTKGKIRDLIPPSAISSATVAVVLNALYFQSAWATPFAPAYTKSMDFHLFDDSVAVVSGMFMDTGKFYFANTPHLQAVELPFEGKRTSVLFLLPRKHGEQAFSELINEFSVDGATALQQVVSEMKRVPVTVTLPSFTLEQQCNLNQMLTKLGMGRAFSKAAEFPALVRSRDPLVISSVDHKAFLRVTEAGVEAAAATSVSIAARSMPIEKVQPHINLNRPFLFLLRDVDSGCVFFAGAMIRPLSTAT